MPVRPDYATLTRGQIAVLDRLNAGEAGLPVLHQIVRLAQDSLGGIGAGFAEYRPDHGRMIAATGACARALGRKVDRDDRPADLDGADRQRVLAARCATGGKVIGSLHVSFDEEAFHEDAFDEHRGVLQLLASYVGRLYGYRAGLPVHGDDARRPEDRDLWVAVTSHELRTPVTVIKGYADTLTNHWESLGEDGRQEAVRVIGARAGELARLVDRLLSAASDDGAGGSAPPGPFDLAEALRHAVDELPAELRRRFQLRHLPAELPKAYGDRDSLATILTELATNADKNSPPDTDVELGAEADDQTVRFWVADRGTGVKPEHVERAFERYWQADTGDRQLHPGAGLGLYLVRRIVERQHGWVSLRPRDGGGTIAEVRLPRG
jgi:signal transduction histidine kinase